MSARFWIIQLFLALSTLGAIAQDEINSDPLTVRGEISAYQLKAGQNGTITLHLSLPDGVKAYEDQMKVAPIKPEDLKVGSLSLQPVFEFYDKFSKKNRKAMSKDAKLSFAFELPLELSSSLNNIDLELTYQACTESYCLFPKKKSISIPVSIEGNGNFNILKHFEKPDLNKVMERSLFLSLLLVFFAGILTSFTPCIFPMIPITLAILGHNAERKRRTNFLLSVLYVLGIATTYSLLGVAAATTGSLFGSILGSPIALSFIAGIFIIMSLGMFGLFEIKIPSFIEKKFHIKHASAHHPHFGRAYVSGIFAGLVASPCVGPVLVSILTYVGQSKDLFLGFILLFTYAIGLGQIFLVLGAVTEVKRFLPRSGPWMNFTKFLFGSLMLLAAFYYLELLLPVRFFDMAIGVALIILSSAYGAFGPILHPTPILRIAKGILMAVFMIGVAYFTLGILDLRPAIQQHHINTSDLNHSNGLKFATYTDALLEQALKQKKPVIIDFYADWCAACVELEQKTFTNPVVMDMGQEFVLLKFDATQDSEELKMLKKKYNIQGLPAVQFYDLDGKHRLDLTLTQYEEPTYFARRMREALHR